MSPRIGTSVVQAAATVVVTALSSAGPASAAPLVKEQYVEVPDCKTTTQVCSIVPSVEYWFTTPEIKVEFTANQNHCAPMIDHIMIDGYEWGFRVVDPGENDGGQIIPIFPVPGYHTVGVKAEGIKSGCNTGFIGAWGGMLRVSEYHPNSGINVR